MGQINPIHNFYTLPKRLQDKIRPPVKKTQKQIAIELAMLESIEPQFYRNATTLQAVKNGIGENISPLEDGEYPQNYRPAASGDAAAAPGAGCDSPPTTNRGGKSEVPDSDRLPSFEAKELLKVVPVGKRNGFQMVAVPLPDKGYSVKHSFLDWVNFTFKVDDFQINHHGYEALSDDDYVRGFSDHLYDVFGFGVTSQRERGLNFYEKSYEVGHHGWGQLCIGGQLGSCLVTIKGQGLMSAKPGWELRLYNLLKRIPSAKLTRVDLAMDDYYSDTSLDDYYAMYKAGLFTNRGRPPQIEKYGDWDNENIKGRTIYVGSRKGGKLLRIYEKGKQLANGFHELFPNWVRVELELKNIDRVIPFEVLLRPGQYLAGGFPALAKLNKVQDRIATAKKVVKSTVERSIEIINHQYGKYFWALEEIYGRDYVYDRITFGKKGQIPKKLNFDTFAQFEESTYLHTVSPITLPIEAIFYENERTRMEAFQGRI